MPRITSLNDLKRKGKLIKGQWKLDRQHRLIYQAVEEKEQFQFESSLIAAEPDALVVSVTGKQDNGKIVTNVQKLTGQWRANEKNQIEFEVERESGNNDLLTFRASWTLNESQQIVYTYRKHYLKTKRPTEETLIFKGFWDITEQNRLTYLLEGSDNSAFRFRGAFQTTSVLAKKGEIRYQLGAEMRSAKKQALLTLFGIWKFSRKLELSFEIEYSKTKKQAIHFNVEWILTKDLVITARLLTRKGEPIGVEVLFTKEFFGGDGEVFLRLKKTLANSTVEAGIAASW